MGLFQAKKNKEKCPECGRMVWTLLYNGKCDVCIECYRKIPVCVDTEDGYRFYIDDNGAVTNGSESWESLDQFISDMEFHGIRFTISNREDI